MLDLSAAFDTLDHTLLVEKLRLYFGFSGTALQWFSSYLHGLSQRVIIGDAISSPTYLEFGVPQGSILGPLLFTLYIAPLQDVIQAYNLNCMFYADDSQVHSYFEKSCRRKCTRQSRKALWVAFGFTVLQRNLKELARKAMKMCLRVLTESNKSRFDSYSRQEQCIDHIPYYLSRLSRAHFSRQPFLE